MRFYNSKEILHPPLPRLQAMALVYSLHHEEIGQFNDTRYIVTMLARTCDKAERDRLLLFLNKVKKCSFIN